MDPASLGRACEGTGEDPPLRYRKLILQGPLILAERWTLRFLRSNFGIQLPTLARIAYTLTILLFLGHYLFFVPAERMGLCQNFAAAMRHFFAALAGLKPQPLPAVHWG